MERAREQSIRYGRREEMSPDEAGVIAKQRPAFLKYAGIRKVEEVRCASSGPEHGTLVTSFGIEPQTPKDFRRLIDCESATVTLFPCAVEIHDAPSDEPSELFREKTCHWYGAHNIFRIEDGVQPHRCLETVVLLALDEESIDLDAAAQKQGLRWQQKLRIISKKRVHQVRYVGTRKIISCSNIEKDNEDGRSDPDDGTEVSFSKYTLLSEEQLSALLLDETAQVRMLYNREYAMDEEI